MKTSTALAANTNATTKPAAKAVTVWEIATKDRVCHGNTYPGSVVEGHHAEIVPGVRVRLFGLLKAGRKLVMGPEGRYVPCEESVYRVDFKIGDEAVCAGGNLTYTGTITAITAKTITVVQYHGTSNAHTYRMSLADFDGKNWDFDAEAIAKRNDAWMD